MMRRYRWMISVSEPHWSNDSDVLIALEKIPTEYIAIGSGFAN